MVTSGGAGNGGLSTLAGYGTFSSFGQPAGTLRLVEHLGITGSGDSAAATPKDRLGRLAWGAAAPGARISR